MGWLVFFWIWVIAVIVPLILFAIYLITYEIKEKNSGITGEASDEFRKKYCVSLSDAGSFTQRIENPYYYEEISSEVFAVLKQMDSWKDKALLILNREQIDELIREGYYNAKELKKMKSEDVELARSILLAKQGKLDCFDTAGFPAWIQREKYPGDKASNDIAKKRHYELVEWITNTLQSRGVNLTPVYLETFPEHTGFADRYIWAGTSYYVWACRNNQEIKPFSRDLIE